MAALAFEGFQSCTIDAAVQEADTIFTNVDNVGITCRSPGLKGTSKCAEINPTTTAAVRNSSFTPMSTAVYRFIFKFTNAPGANVMIAQMCNGDPNLGGSTIATMWLTTDRKLNLRDVWTSKVTSTTVLATGTEYAVEWRFDGGSTKEQTLRIFTDTDSVATPVETVGPTTANLSAETSTDWINIGKMTNVTWTGGFSLDQYRRCDDWWAAASTFTYQYNEEWVGTAGTDITLPANWILQGPNTNLPSYQAGGPHTDQSHMRFGNQTTGNRRVRSSQLPAVADSYERFYFNIEVKPLTTDEQFLFWSAGSTPSGRPFAMVAKSGAGDLVDIEVFADDLWDPYTVDPDPAPVPLGTFTGVQQDTWHRVEIHIDDYTGPANIEVRLWRGALRHSANAADANIITGACTSTEVNQYRRYGHYLHADAPAGTTLRRVSFDCTATSNDGWIGPLAEADQYDPPLNTQWTFYEWDGAALTPLTLAGASTGGATLEEVGFPGGTEPPPTGKLFTADPGLGKKLYVGFDTYWDTDRYNQVADLMNFEMRTLSAGTGHPASDRVAPGCYRGFYSSPRPTISWGKHTDTNWTIHRKVAANTAMSVWSCDNQDYAGAVSQYDGTSDAWLTNQLAPMLKEAYSRYGHLTVIDLANEPDAWTKAPNQSRVPRWFTATRRAARYIYFFLRDQCNVPEEAYMIDCATTLQETSYEHEKRHAKAVLTTGTAWPGATEGEQRANRADTIYYLCPDWKGTRTVASGYWSDAYDPNPADFIQPGEMDEWGYGRGPIARIYDHNFYERDYEYANIETLAEFKSKVVSLMGGYPRGGNLFKFLKALYGGASPVLPVPSANANGIPVFIGELGIGVWVPLPSSENAAVPSDTADAYCNIFMKDLVEKCNVVGFNHWRYVQDVYGSSSVTANADTYTLHRKVGSGSGAGTNLWDSTNANTKAYAAIFNTTWVADPPPWPDGTTRPPNVSLNGGAKRDRRGINDV